MNSNSQKTQNTFFQTANQVVLAACFAVGLLSLLTGTSRASDDSILKLNDAAGASQFAVQDSNTNDVITMNSLGAMTMTSNGTAFSVFPSTGYASISNRTTTSSGLSDVANFGFHIGTNETWTYEFNLYVTGVTGGTEYAINGPAGAAMTATVFGNLNAVGTFSMSPITSLNTADAVPFSTVNAGLLLIRITGSITNAGTAGTCQLRWLSVTNLNTSTINTGSYFVARRVL